MRNLQFIKRSENAIPNMRMILSEDEDAPCGSGTQQAQREAAKKRQREAEGEE